ncbi:ribonuclease HI family protein [Staphylococcus pettenkoferi]|uniref:Ribonuclease HI family protein n=1 Tax=Staphylococcus pettenkoferi TaxID=170573 RepID=A0ABT4BJ18_9STAP|nr:ribonuclease HI family protein [Staphylococcus pettenkoferi]MCY1582666.1 ribonuclease HI family protein [Staphylococcus pettenkoferi]
MAKIYFDAATSGNPGPSVGAAVIITETERKIETTYLGEMDNHTAEWAAFKFALELASQHQVDNALVYTDSKLIEDSMQSESVKNPLFRPYFEQIQQLESHFLLLFVKWIPRKSNREANHYAQQGLFQYLKSNKNR